MAASVRIEDEAFSDTRYAVLAAEAGLADADHARGKMAVLWRQCTLEQRYTLPVADVEKVLGERAVGALKAARLGSVCRSGIRIHGARGRIEWLQRLRENGRRGGRPKKPDGLASGSTELNPPAPAPAPAPVKTPKRKREPFARPTAAQVEAYCEETGIRIDAQRFVDFYASKGWRVGSEPMRDWQAAVRGWHRRDLERGNNGKPRLEDEFREGMSAFLSRGNQ